MSLKIVAVNERFEPFNSDILDETPKYVNLNEPVYFTYLLDESLKGDEKFVWDFDYASTSLVTDTIIQEMIGMSETDTLSSTFYRNGNRIVNLKIYDKVYLQQILSTQKDINFPEQLSEALCYNPNTNKHYITSIENTYLIDTNLNIISEHNSVVYNNVVYNSYNNKLYANDNTNLYIIDALNDTVIETIQLSNIIKIISNNRMCFVQTDTDVYVYDNNIVIKTYQISQIEYVDENYLVTKDWEIYSLDAFYNITLFNNIADTDLKQVKRYNNNLILAAKDVIRILNLSTNTYIKIISITALSDNYIIALYNNYLYYSDTKYFYSNHFNKNIYYSQIYCYDLVSKTTIKVVEYPLIYENLVTHTIKDIYYNAENNTIVTTQNITYHETNITESKIVFFTTDLYENVSFVFPYNVTFLNNDILNLEDNVKYLKYVTKQNLGYYDYKKLLYEDTINFNVFKFPTEIIGLDYAVENQEVNYYTNSENAESYIWKVDNVVVSTDPILVFNFNNIKSKISCIIRNGYSQIELYKTLSLSVGSSVIGERYEGNVKDKLLFFNKEGDNLNFEYITDENNLNYWKGDMLFHHNSNDLFKTIGLYTLEKVEPFQFRDENLYTRKVQLFNEYGISFHKGYENYFYIDNIEKVNNYETYYTKWIYSNNIHNFLSKGDEILLYDIYNGVVNNDILDSYSIIPELSSIDNDYYLFTVVDIKQNAVMICSDTNNKDFDTNYIYGEYRLQNNSIKNIPQGYIKKNNIIKLYDIENSNQEWNEPFIKSLLYERKKLTIVNTSLNDSVVTVDYKDYKSKIKKIKTINLSDINDLGFQLKIVNKKSKILLSSSPVDFLPRSFNGYLNQNTILVWEKTLSKDYTPNLLTKNTVCSFEQKDNITNFEYLYVVKQNDIASNILKSNSDSSSGCSISITDLNISNIEFTIGKTTHIIDGTNWKEALTITDANAYLFDTVKNIPELSVVLEGEEIYMYSIYDINIKENEYLKIKKGILSNNPKYGIINNKWVLLDYNANGYIHYNIYNNIFYIYYQIDNVDNWYALSGNKRIVFVDPTDDVDYLVNGVSNAYLENNEIILKQNGSDNKISIIENFITKYQKTLQDYDISVYYKDDKLFFENLLTSENLDPSKDYNELFFENFNTTSYVDSTSFLTDYVVVDYLSVKETLNEEKNYNKSTNFCRKIHIKDIESKLSLLINGINFTVNYNNLSTPSLTSIEDTIVDIDETLKDWGNQRFSLEQDITPDDDSDIGKPYYQILQELGCLVYLESNFSNINGIDYYDTLVLESKYPNVNIDYSINGTYNQHRIFHSFVKFYEIVNTLKITINNNIYTINVTDIEDTIKRFVAKYSEILLESNIIIDYKDNILMFFTLEEKTTLKYTVNAGKTNIYNSLYEIIDYRLGNCSVVVSGNEIRNNYTDMQSLGFATGMITSLSYSKFPLNNQEYNLIFVDPNVLGISYQGAFWDETEYNENITKNRNGFDWTIYDEYTSIIDFQNYEINDYETTSAINSIYEPNSKCFWVLDDFKIKIINKDIEDSIILDKKPTHIIYNSFNKKIYVSFFTNNLVKVYDYDKTFITDILVNYTKYLEYDKIRGTVYSVNQYSNSVSFINPITHIIDKTISIGYRPIKLIHDYINDKLFILNLSASYSSIYDLNTNIVYNTPLKNSYTQVRECVYDDNRYIYVSYDNYITKIDMETNTTNDITLGFIVNKMIYNKNMLYFLTTDKIIKYDIANNSTTEKEIIANYISYNSLSDKIMVVSDDIVIIDNNLIVEYNIDNNSYDNIVDIEYSKDGFLTVSKSNISLISAINDVIDNNILKLNVREFLRYPRERLDNSDPIKFKFSWKDNNDKSMFFYDFSGEQLFITNNNKRIIDKKTFNYVGKTPLLDENNNGYLNRTYNTNISEIYNPLKQQTVFDELYYDIILIDSETDIDSYPTPMQTFIGYNSLYEGFNSNTILIERLENISTTIITEKDKNIIIFENNIMYIENSTIDFIKLGFKKNQIIELLTYNIEDVDDKLPFMNSGLQAIIEKVNINKLILKPINKNIINEKSIQQIVSNTLPYSVVDAMFSITINVLPERVAEITLKGQTEIEDERFKVMLNNIGYNINHRDIYIFDDYDINENGIDYSYLNEKRKEMLLVFPEIYNYLGSYKAVINAINYFGYEDLEFYEYYMNINKNSDKYNKYYKIQIPDIFNNQIESWKENDYIKLTMPNNNYKKTNLFNLTYRITDYEGNYKLAYSPDEIMIKLLGLKKWLRENIMPIGTRLKDLTGVGETLNTTTISNTSKMCRKFCLNENLTAVKFIAKAYKLPDNVYNIHLDFSVNSDEYLSDYYTVKYTTFKEIPDQNDINFYFKAIQTNSFYKTDLKSLSFIITEKEQYILIETNQENSYGLNYQYKKLFKLRNLI